MPQKIISLEKDIQAQSSSQISPKHSRPKLFSFRTDGLNLHKLPAEPPFDAKIAMSHTVVERRGHAHDLAFLLMHGDVAAYAAISRMPIMLASIAFCVLAPLGWPEESGFPGPAKFEPPDHNTILIIGQTREEFADYVKTGALDNLVATCSTQV